MSRQDLRLSEVHNVKASNLACLGGLAYGLLDDDELGEGFTAFTAFPPGLKRQASRFSMDSPANSPDSLVQESPGLSTRRTSAPAQTLQRGQQSPPRTFHRRPATPGSQEAGLETSAQTVSHSPADPPTQGPASCSHNPLCLAEGDHLLVSSAQELSGADVNSPASSSEPVAPRALETSARPPPNTPIVQEPPDLSTCHSTAQPLAQRDPHSPQPQPLPHCRATRSPTGLSVRETPAPQTTVPHSNFANLPTQGPASHDPPPPAESVSGGSTTSQEDDATLGEESSTASLTSSIFEFREIHGRTYHAPCGNAEYW